jgi:hypothetical protein
MVSSLLSELSCASKSETPQKDNIADKFSFIGLAFYFVDAGGAQWRPPLAIQCVFTLVLGLGIWLLPESPRWRMRISRKLVPYPDSNSHQQG